MRGLLLLEPFFRQVTRALKIQWEVSTQKSSGLQAAEEQIGVGDGGLRAAAVADGAGIGAGRFGADAQGSGGVEAGERTSTGADGVDVEHGHADREAGDLGVGGRGDSPSTSETSVEVPPMSKEMIWSKPLARAVAEAPTTPPAGPESTVRTGSRAAVERVVMPPLDCMTKIR